MKTSKLMLAIFSSVAFLGATTVKAATVVPVTDYTTLNTCLSVDDNVCKLSNDITATDNILFGEHPVTIDLNGYTLDMGTKNISSIDNKTAKLTIIDSGTTGTITSTAHRTLFVSVGGNLDVEDGTIINNARNGIAIDAISDGTETHVKVGAKALLKGGFGISIDYMTGNDTTGDGAIVDFYGSIETFTPSSYNDEGHIGINVNGRLKATTGSVPVINIYEGSSIKAPHGTCPTCSDNANDSPAIYGAGYAIWNIYGGTITGDEALSIKSGKFNITGGKLNATGAYIDPATSYGSGSESTGAAISITNNNAYARNVSLTISGGAVTSTNGSAIYESDTQNQQGNAVTSLSITGGSFTSSDSKDTVYSKNNTGFITGGIYNVSPATAYVIDTKVVEEQDGLYYVGTKHDINLTSVTGGVITSSLAQAINGEIVTITVTPATGYQLNTMTGVTFTKVNDTTYTFVMPNEDVTLVPEFSLIPAKATSTETPTNPDTLDNTIVYLMIAGISLTIICTMLFMKKHVN